MVPYSNVIGAEPLVTFPTFFNLHPSSEAAMVELILNWHENGLSKRLHLTALPETPIQEILQNATSTEGLFDHCMA